MLRGVIAWLVLSTAPDVLEEGRGVGLELPAQRVRSRVAGSLSGLVSFGLAEGIPALDPKIGLGLAADLGLLINDRLALHFHAEFSAFPLGFLPDGNNFLLTAGGPTINVFLSDHFTIGTGAYFFLHSGQLRESGVSVPLRAAWLPAARGAADLRRRGLQLGLELAPGLALSALIRGAGFPLVFSAGLTAGYGWW